MNNGRINIMGPNTGDLFTLYNKKPIQSKSTAYKDALIGNQQSSLLSDLYFSAENIQIVQNAIKAGVYHTSKGQHVIGDLVRRGKKHNLRTPLLEAALCKIELYENGLPNA